MPMPWTCRHSEKEWKSFLADAREEGVGFGPREALVAEVQGFRPHHNLTPGNVLEAVSRALRRHMDQRDLDRILERLPEGAVGFWDPLCDKAELAQRVI